MSQKKKSADFETAIAAAGYGKFQYLLLLAIIPVSWATSIDSSNVAMILPSAECDLQMTFFQKGVLNAIIYVGLYCNSVKKILLRWSQVHSLIYLFTQVNTMINIIKKLYKYVVNVNHVSD